MTQQRKPGSSTPKYDEAAERTGRMVAELIDMLVSAVQARLQSAESAGAMELDVELASDGPFDTVSLDAPPAGMPDKAMEVAEPGVGGEPAGQAPASSGPPVAQDVPPPQVVFPGDDPAPPEGIKLEQVAGPPRLDVPPIVVEGGDVFTFTPDDPLGREDERMGMLNRRMRDDPVQQELVESISSVGNEVEDLVDEVLRVLKRHQDMLARANSKLHDLEIQSMKYGA